MRVRSHPAPVPEDWYNRVSIPRWCPNTSQLLNSSQGWWAVSGAVATKIGFCAEPEKVSARTHSRIDRPGLGVQHTEYDFVTSPGKGPDNKGSGSQGGLLPTCRGVLRLLCLTNFVSMALPLARLHSFPLQFWLKENYKTPANLLEGLKTDLEPSQALLWWCTFKPQPKLICKLLIKEVVTTDASKEGYEDHMNNPSFRGMWSAKKGRNTHINILKLENSVDGLSKVWGSNEGDDCLLSGRQRNSGGISVEGGKNSLWDPKWFCEEYLAQMS